MKFDWYGATISDHPERILQRLSAWLSGSVTLRPVERVPGTQAYAFEDRAADFLGTRVFGLLSGGHNSKPHVRTSGVYSPLVAQGIRECYPDHSVSRVDVAVDFDAPGAWDLLVRHCREVATALGLKWTVLGDDRPVGIRDVLSTRTVYVGSRSSSVFIRLYEKGLFEISKGNVYGLDGKAASEHWVRIEIEIKPPNRPAKMRAAFLQPQEFWGCSQGSRAILARILSVDVERVTMTEHRKADYERALLHMAVQYRSALESFIQHNDGDDQAVMRFIRRVWSEMDSSQIAS